MRGAKEEPGMELPWKIGSLGTRLHGGTYARSSSIPWLWLRRSQGPAAQGLVGTRRAARRPTVPPLHPCWSHHGVSVPTNSQRHVESDSGQVFLLLRRRECSQWGSDQSCVPGCVPFPPAAAGGDGEGQSRGTAPGPLPTSHGLRCRLVLRWGRVFVFHSPAGSSSKNFV